MPYILPVFLAQRVDIKEPLRKLKSWIIIHSTVKKEKKVFAHKMLLAHAECQFNDPIKSDVMNSS